MIILYTTHCPKCNVLEQKLNNANISFTTNTDINEMLDLGFMSAPILAVNDEYMEFKDACTWVDNQKG